MAHNGYLSPALKRLYYFHARHGTRKEAGAIFDRLAALPAPGRPDTLARVGENLYEITKDPSIVDVTLAAYAAVPEAEQRNLSTILRLSGLLRAAQRPAEAVALLKTTSPQDPAWNTN